MNAYLTPGAATLAAFLTFELAGWGRSVASVALASVLAGVLACLLLWSAIVLERRSRPWRVNWHRMRAVAIRDRGSRLSGLWPMMWVVGLIMTTLEWRHILRAEALGL